MKPKQLGLPYMGSKRKIASKILDYICSKNPKANIFYDLFGGGGAISFEALQRSQFRKVIYNELNTGVVRLLEKIRDDGVTPEFYQWVSREEFHKHKNDNTWFGGLVKTCWSFGNIQRTYLFNPGIETVKRLLHEMVVNKCNQSRFEFDLLMGIIIPKKCLLSDDIHERRLAVLQAIKAVIAELEYRQHDWLKYNVNQKQIDGQFDRMKFFNHIEILERLKNLKKLRQLEHLGRLQRLEHLSHFERLPHLEIRNQSYLDVVIDSPIEETIIYLDPPYENAGTYQCKISHEKLYSYIKNSPYKIYMSSYDAPFNCVWESEHRSTVTATKARQVIEKLYCNQTENDCFELI
jgi:site-specific DNA-adenine methylase